MKKIFLLTAVLSLTTAVFAAGEPFAAWNFDNVNGTIVPPVAGKRNLVLQNMPNVKVVPGKNGQAVAFLGKDKERNTVGSSYVSSIKFDCSKPFTIETVFKLNKDAGYRNFKEILCFADSERGPGLIVAIFYDRIIVRSGDGKKIFDMNTDATKTAITRDKWHFLTVTYDGKTVSIYFNGVQAAAKELTVTCGKYTTMFVGSFRNAYAYALQGAVDELKLYNFAKTSAEVAEAYLAFEE